MRLRSKLISSVLALTSLSSAASAAVIGGAYYAPQYDYAEFFAATDGRYFQVMLNGMPALPGFAPNDVANALLPLMQAAKPRPALTRPAGTAASLLPAGPDLRSRARLCLEPGVCGRAAAVQAGASRRVLRVRRLLP